MAHAMTALLSTLRVTQLAHRAFLRGVASAFDLRGDTRRQYRFHQVPAAADAAALADDWRQVGEDMRVAMDRFHAEHAGR